MGNTQEKKQINKGNQNSNSNPNEKEKEKEKEIEEEIEEEKRAEFDGFFQKENEEEFSMFYDIPDDLVIYICRFLDQNQLILLAQSCKKFEELAFEPCLWNDRSISLYQTVNRFTIVRLTRTVEHLQGIRMKHCRIQNLPSFFDEMKKRCGDLKTLELHSCFVENPSKEETKLGSIAQLSSSLKNLPQLTELSLPSSRLGTIPPEIYKLKQLQKLNLVANQFNSNPFTSKISNLDSLKELRLDMNDISIIEPNIFKLKHMEVLSFSFNSISALPSEIGNLTELRNLRLSNNSISFLPNTMKSLLSLKTIEIGSNRLGSFPDVLLECQDLERIELFNNQIRTIPNEINKLSNLKVLKLNSNQIQEIPSNLFKLEHLEFLDLRLNQISSIPIEISNAKSLHHLIIFGNKLTSLPHTICFLHLQQLSVQGNQILSLPSEFGDTQFALTNSLTHLDLSSNSLTEISESIINMKNLLYLDLTKNSGNSSLAYTLRSYFKDWPNLTYKLD
ncbi:leucine rich repeat containing protein [Anaeramoeba ignava]|uniref:Leucine rich repeat containing protein n=1 Tax=Anaeramoeba ignava TaxID=1746090 RepID=A0A9Q0L7I3_ANAIG|nr:leucine rich repeat containing protein [Anaeramoeba ignava]